MQRVILAVLDRPQAARACLDAAWYAAGVLEDARIAALAIRTPPEAALFPSEEVLTNEHRAELVRREEARLATLRAVFTGWQSARGPGAEWIEDEGTIEDEVERHGRIADLIVTARAGTALHAALYDTQRPILVIPDKPGGSIGRSIAIAWHDDAPAGRAVLAAMPFLAAAERIWLLLDAGQDVAPRLPPVLAEHRIAAVLRPVVVPSGDIGRALLAEAHAVGADLLVMGAFAHNELSEAVLGGVTRTMLDAADIPLLMQH